MFEGVHDRLPDLQAYLRRLGIGETPAPTRENLDRLIYAHLTHVPYENLSYCIEKKCPDLTVPAEERQIGGLGVFMVKKTMDDVTYEYKDGKNTLTLRKNL